MQPEQGQTYWQPDQEHDDEPLNTEPVEQVETPPPHPTDQPITWQASEYIQHDKQMMWYAVLAGATVLLLLVSIFLVKSWTFAVLIIVMAISVAILAGRPPRVMQYTLSAQGLQVNEKAFSYHDFRAFGVIQDGPLYSVILIPNKRFMPAVNVYFPAEQGEHIVDLFGAVLPMEHLELDLVEKITRKLRF